jgi:hypothetical protein
MNPGHSLGVESEDPLHMITGASKSRPETELTIYLKPPKNPMHF